MEVPWPFRRRRTPASTPTTLSTPKDVLAWWFAGGVHAGRAKIEVGAHESVPGPPQPGTHGLHASRGVLGALAYAHSFTLCRVSMAGSIAEAGDQLAATERTVLWAADLHELLPDVAARWIERALAASGEPGTLSTRNDHRAAAVAARERAIAAEQRVRDARWMLDEGAGRKEGAARERALGELRGARFALREARAAACAHEAAGASTEGDVRAVARAVSLAIDSLAELEADPDGAVSSVRAKLERELEERLARDGAPIEQADAARVSGGFEREPPPKPPDDQILPIPGPDRASELAKQLTRGSRGILRVYALTPGPDLARKLPSGTIAILVECCDEHAARRLASTLDLSGLLDRTDLGVVCTHRGAQPAWTSIATTAAVRFLDDPNLAPLQSAVKEALEHELSWDAPDTLLRLRCAVEPTILEAGWIEWGTEPIVALRVEELSDESRAAAERIAAFYRSQSLAVTDGWRVLRTPEAAFRLDGRDERRALARSLARPVYERKCGLRGPEPGSALPPFTESLALTLSEPVLALPPTPDEPAAPIAAPAPPKLTRLNPSSAARRLDFGSKSIEGRVPRWVQAVRALCRKSGGATSAHPIGSGEAELAAPLRAAHIAPIAIFVDDEDAFGRHAVRASRDTAFAELGLGVVLLKAKQRYQIQGHALVVDDRLEVVANTRLRELLADAISGWDYGPNLLEQRNPAQMLGLGLRGLIWNSAPDTACAGWLGETSDSASPLLAVLSQTAQEAERMEAAIGSAYPGIGLVQIWPEPNESLARAIEADRVRMNGHARTALSSIHVDAWRSALAQSFAERDVYAREWMLVQPRFRSTSFVPAVPPSEPASSTARPKSTARPTATAVGSGPTARCPRCDVQYWLPIGTPLASTRCGACDNPMLVPEPVSMRFSTMEGTFDCPACAARIRALYSGGGAHVRCPACGRAVRPIEVSS